MVAITTVTKLMTLFRYIMMWFLHDRLFRDSAVNSSWPIFESYLTCHRIKHINYLQLRGWRLIFDVSVVWTVSVAFVSRCFNIWVTVLLEKITILQNRFYVNFHTSNCVLSLNLKIFLCIYLIKNHKIINNFISNSCKIYISFLE